MLDKVLFYTENIFESLGINKKDQYKSLNIVSLIGFMVGIVISLFYIFRYSIYDYFLLWIFRCFGIIVIWLIFLIFYFILAIGLSEIKGNNISIIELIVFLFAIVELFVVSVVLGSCVGVEGVLIMLIILKMINIKVKNIFHLKKEVKLK